MTTPALSVATPLGRVYRRPGALMPDDITSAVETGVLVPSVTNVIGVAAKPYLQAWAAKLAANAAVDAATRFPAATGSRPDRAAKWAAGAATRYTAAAAARGDRVHDLCEQIINGPTPTVPDELAGYIDAYDAFTREHDVRYAAAETTLYGETRHGGYAGTADFHATVDGVTVVGDWKTGKHVGDEAAMQLAALANAGWAAAGDRVRPAPRVHTGLVVQLRGDGGYRLAPVNDLEAAFEAFTQLRAAWFGHANRLAARQPLLLGAPWQPATGQAPAA